MEVKRDTKHYEHSIIGVHFVVYVEQAKCPCTNYYKVGDRA